MGSKCSCLGSSTQDKTEFEYQSPLDSSPKKDKEFNDLFENSNIPKQTQISLQSLARGYLLSKPLLQKKRKLAALTLEKAMNRRSSKALMKKHSSQIADEMLGELNLKIPLTDGVKVTKKKSLRLTDGSVYEGEWNEKNKKHGRGLEKRSDGTELCGYYKRGFLEGIGRALFKDGSIYQGNFKRGKPSGIGVFIDTDQCKYTGEFKNGEFLEMGIKESPDGSVYEGLFSGMMIHGRGKIIWKNQDVYEGEFSQGSIHGKGVYRWKDGKVYQGEVSNGEVNGRGTIKFLNGDLYEGSVENGLSQGKGMLRTAKGEVHKCYWVDGLQQGNGTISYKDENAKIRLVEVVWDNGNIIQYKV